MGIGTWLTSWALVGNVSTAYVFTAKFGWNSDEARLYNALINAGGVAGLMIGSMLGFPLI